MKLIDSRIDSERVVLGSALLVGWAIWTAWRHLILPALIAGGGLLLVMTGWRPEPAPVPYSSAAMVLAEQRASGDAMEARVICPRVDAVQRVQVRKGEPASLKVASDAVQWVQEIPPADQPLSKRVPIVGEPMLEAWSHDLDGEPTLQNVTPVKELPAAVRQQIRASLDRLSREG